MPHSTCRHLLILAAGIALSSCAGTSTPEPAEPESPKAFWKGDQASGSPKIVINLSSQRVHFYKAGQLVGSSPISSGREGHNTTNGTFRIIEKEVSHRSSLYGAFVDSNNNIVVGDVDAREDTPPPGTRFLGADMRYFMRITGAIGMHQGYLPGYPASHGCIRLPGHMAENFYHAAPLGTPVQIIGHASLAPIEPAYSSDSHSGPNKSNNKKSPPKAKKGPAIPRGTTLYL